MDYSQTAALVAGALLAAYALHKRYNRPLIKDIRGPDNPSWIFGRSSVTKSVLGRFR